jgi:hypothetical protein
MKIALMILFVWGGLTMTTTTAQSCVPCPPGCCKVESCEPGKGSASANQNQAVQNALVSFSPEAMTATCDENKMSVKEKKDCQVACQPACLSSAKAVPACQPAATSAQVNQTHVATVPLGCSPKPASETKPGKKS